MLSPDATLSRLCADLALQMAGVAIDPPVWTSLVPRTLALVTLERRQLRPRLFDELTEEALAKVLEQVAAYSVLGASETAGGKSLGSLVKRDDAISDELLEGLEWAVREVLPQGAALGVALQDSGRGLRLQLVHQALRAHRAADDGEHYAAVEAMLEAQRTLVLWLSGDEVLADEAKRLRREQLLKGGVQLEEAAP